MWLPVVLRDGRQTYSILNVTPCRTERRQIGKQHIECNSLSYLETRDSILNATPFRTDRRETDSILNVTPCRTERRETVRQHYLMWLSVVLRDERQTDSIFNVTPCITPSCGLTYRFPRNWSHKLNTILLQTYSEKKQNRFCYDRQCATAHSPVDCQPQAAPLLFTDSGCKFVVLYPALPEFPNTTAFGTIPRLG